MNSPSEAELINLLKKAGRAHHKFETRQLSGVRNQDWPSWYADFLIENGLPALVGASPSTKHLADLLKDLHTSYSALPEQEQQVIDWPSYYAPKLIEHFQTGDPA